MIKFFGHVYEKDGFVWMFEEFVIHALCVYIQNKEFLNSLY